MITETLSERFQEIYHYSESLVFKTVNRPGTNILVSSTYAVLLQLSEGSKYPKRMTNFGEQLVFKTVNRPGTNILVSSTYAVLLQLSEGSKYPKRMTNFGEQERTSLGESRFLRISPAL